MTADLAIADLLAEAGFVEEAAARARSVLEEAGLTRPGKTRIAAAKAAGARDLLRARLAALCGHADCAQGAEGREVVRVPKVACESCAGSANRRAGRAAGAALRAAGRRRLLVLGGAPRSQQDLRAMLEPEGLEVRCVDGTSGPRPAPTVAADLKWADVVVVWASTPLAHKVSTPYVDQAPRGRLLTVPRRGVEAVCQELVRWAS